MPNKRYRLLQNHPYAKKGTILREHSRSHGLLGEPVIALIYKEEGDEVSTFLIPVSVEDDWLEEVKEEVTFTREQADAIHSVVLNEGRYTYATLGDFLRWVDQHTSTEE